MIRPKIKRIAITGFRSFGSVQQIAEPSETVSVFWGGNSNGKTSFGEAIEFLLTGQIARRELLAGAKDEFAASLRNAHIDDNSVVAVDALLVDAEGTEHTVRRELIHDYQRGSAAGCTSRLKIDSKVASETELQTVLGLRLFPPPLQAPVLSQNTLGFLFSSSPADRAAYFRAVLETQDLEEFRQAISVLDESLVRPSGKEVHSVAELQRTSDFSDAHKRLLKCKDKVAVEELLDAELGHILTELGLASLQSIEERAKQLVKEIARRREIVFPMKLLAQKPFVPLDDNRAAIRAAVGKFRLESTTCEKEAVRLLTLFETALKLPHFGEHAPENCPLCNTPGAITEERLSWLKAQNKATEGYQNARKSLVDLLERLLTLNDTARQSARAALPVLSQLDRLERKEAGFTPAALKKLGINEQLVADWIVGYRCLRRQGRRVIAKLNSVAVELKTAKECLDSWVREAELITALDELSFAQSDFRSALASFEGPSKRLVDVIKKIVDQSSSIAGWEALSNLSLDLEGAFAAVASLAEFENQQRAVAKALSEIDKAIGTVQDEKFSSLSEAIRVWWERLRPDEVTFFDAVQRRGVRTRRMIDMRAGLSLKDDKSSPKFRDAVAVFSQSQLHCLGLAIFLARASADRIGFIVLDDPVLTSDDDYRPNFASTVIDGLLSEGIQTIITTQDYSTAKDIETRWAHRNAVRFDIVRDDPRTGSEIRSKDENLAAMISRAQPFCRSQDPEQRKLGAVRLRDAIERFCKLLLVKARIGTGDTMASIIDYDGKNFGSYSNEVKALLIKDASHQGKLQAAHNYVTSGAHDDTPPSEGELRVALGDLRKLKLDYLD